MKCIAEIVTALQLKLYEIKATYHKIFLVTFFYRRINQLKLQHWPLRPLKRLIRAALQFNKNSSAAAFVFHYPKHVLKYRAKVSRD